MFHSRLKVLWLLISAAMLVIVGKLFYLQVLHGEYYRRRADRNIAYKDFIDTRRGHITDRNGIPLAVDEVEYEMCVYLRRLGRLEDPEAWGGEFPCLFDLDSGYLRRRGRVADPRGWCEQLAALLEIETEEVVAAVEGVEKHLQTLAQKGPEWRWKQDLKYFRRRPQPVFTHLRGDQIRRLEIGRERLGEYVEAGKHYPLFTIRDTGHRRYPLGDLAAHIIGYMGRVSPEEYHETIIVDGNEVPGKGYRYSFAGDERKRFFDDDLIGRCGLEARYEPLLRGARGILYGIKDARERVPEMFTSRTPPRPGRDIKLTLDARVQRIAEEELDRQIQLLSMGRLPTDPPVCGAVVLIDPNTGDVLAAASAPRFDLNIVRTHFAELTADPRKVFFHRATLGTYPIGSVFKIVVAVGALQEDLIKGHTEFSCYGTFADGARQLKCTGAHGDVELTRAIEQSCNVYFWNTGLLVGPKRMKQWAEAMGLGRRAGADLIEARGKVPLPVSRADVLNLTIGQGPILCTPLQVARMMGCVAVPGTLPDTRFCLIKPVRIRQLDVDADRIGPIRWGMRDVVHGPRGTARSTAPVAGLTYAGKTGTAQTARKDIYHAWFAGFAPFRKPTIAFSCVIENTRAHGGSGAAPVIQRIFTRMRADTELVRFLPTGEL